MDQYKIIDESKQTVYGSAVVPGNAALYLLRLEKMGEYDFSGKLFNLYIPEAETFHSLSEAILKMDRIMNKMNYPEADTKLRNLTKKSYEKKQVTYDRLQIEKLPHIIQYWHPTLFSHPSKNCANVFIRVLYRQHSSWQGTVLWCGPNGTKRKIEFRSVLELLNILQSAISFTNIQLPEWEGICCETC